MDSEEKKTELSREERLARRKAIREKRRKRMEMRTSRLTITVFFGFYLLLVIFNVFFPRSDTSEIEKRSLAEFPSFSLASYFSGEFTSGITTWFDDTVPFRDTFKNLNNNIKNLFGITSGSNVEVIGNVQKVNDSTDDGSEDTESVISGSTESVVSSSASSDTEEETASTRDYRSEEAEGTYSNGFVIINQDGHWRGLPLYPGGDCEEYINFMNELYAQIGDEVTVYAMPIPLASEYYLPSNYSEYSVDQTAAIEEVFSQLDDGIVKVDVTDTLDAHKEEDIYLRTDHHWSQLGAYYAVEVLAEAAGVPYADLEEDYTEYSSEGYVGSLYGYTQSANLLNDPEVFTWYEPNIWNTADYYDTSFNWDYNYPLIIETDVANSYLKYMGGDDKIVKVTTSADTGRKILVLKDSYGNAAIPSLTGSFDEIYVFDMRYNDMNLVDFIEAMEITDFVFLADMDSVAYQSVKDLDTLLTQNKGNTIVDEAPAVSEEDSE